MVEHVTFNHGVLGSIPSALTKQNQILSYMFWTANRATNLLGATPGATLLI